MSYLSNVETEPLPEWLLTNDNTIVIGLVCGVVGGLLLGMMAQAAVKGHVRLYLLLLVMQILTALVAGICECGTGKKILIIECKRIEANRLFASVIRFNSLFYLKRIWLDTSP